MIDLLAGISLASLLCFFVVHVLVCILKYIPGLQGACNKEVRCDPRFLAFLPDYFKTQEMCIKALEVDPWPLKYVAENSKTQGMCKKAVKIGPWVLAYVPDNIKTQKICKKAVEEDRNMLQCITD